MIIITNSEYKFLKIFRETKNYYLAVSKYDYSENTFRNNFYQLRKKGVIKGCQSSFECLSDEDIQVKPLNTRQSKILEKAREAKKNLTFSPPPKKKEEKDMGFHFVEGKRVEHPIKVKPLEFKDGRIFNVYPEFPKAS